MGMRDAWARHGERAAYGTLGSTLGREGEPSTARGVGLPVVSGVMRHERAVRGVRGVRGVHGVRGVRGVRWVLEDKSSSHDVTYLHLLVITQQRGELMASN